LLADALSALRGRRLTDEDGNPEILELLPPATSSQLADLEQRLPSPLPREIRAALGVSTGLANGPLESWSLLGLGGFGIEEIFPAAHSIAHDGYGNYWVIDLHRESQLWGPVFYACHDPPVIVYQARTVEEFLNHTIQLWQPGARSPVDVVHEDATTVIWQKNPGLISQTDALKGPDHELRRFAADLTAEFMIVDLRGAKTGQGFSWGRFGPKTKWRRHGLLPIWAVGRPTTTARVRAWLFGS